MGWDRVRGHDLIRDRLAAALARGRLAHAYLFAGPDGVGKRLFAGELAKTLLCENPPAPFRACDACHSCNLVEAGTHPDVFFARKPDDKLELPVEAVRELCGQLGLKPSRGSRKVAVVEDADDFNDESANCFLKTLEEPPPGSLLILLAATAETQLPTILSRCQIVRFQPLPAAVVRDVLAEHGETDPAKVDRLVRLAGGSAGRALALRDDALWGFRQTLLDALTADRPNPVALAEAWARFVEDAGKETAAQRARASVVVRLLLDLLQTAVKLSLGPKAATDSPETNRLAAFAERVGPDGLADGIEKCLEADYHIDRRVQLVLLIESLTDHLTRLTAAGGG